MHKQNDEQFNRRRNLINKINMRDGIIELSLTSEDWAIPGDNKNAKTINQEIARLINCATRGVKLLVIGLQAIDLFSERGEATGESIRTLCELLAEVTQDHGYLETGQHYRDYRAGWRHLDDIVVRDNFLWIGDPEEAPLPDAIRRYANTRDAQPYGLYGVGVTIPDIFGSRFRVEGKRRDGQLVAVRVELEY